MGKTTTKILVALAAAFVLIAVFQARRTSGPAPEEFRVESLFPGLDLAAVAAVRIENAGETLTLQRADGGAWGVDQRAGYPVDGEKLRRLGLGIAQLQARDRLTDNPDKYATLGLGDPPEGGTVTLLDSDGNPLAVLRLGQRKQPKGAGGSSGQFVRVGDDPAVYLVASVPAADTAVTGWLDRKLLDLAADQVVGISVARDAGAFAASRQQPSDPLTLETPLPAGRSANSSALGDLGRALVNLSCDDALAADDEALAGAVFSTTFSARTADGVRYDVSLAEHDGKHYARLAAEAAPQEPEAEPAVAADGEKEPAEAAAKTAADPETTAAAFNQRHAGWSYTLPKYAYERLNKTLDDLLAAKETP